MVSGVVVFFLNEAYTNKKSPPAVLLSPLQRLKGNFGEGDLFILAPALAVHSVPILIPHGTSEEGLNSQ